MKILLVEDDEDKRQQLSTFLKLKVSPDIVEARSLQGAVRSLVAETFNLIILDMSMPTFDITPTENGGRPQPFGGREILQQMARRRISTKVVVVTQFDNFNSEEEEITIVELDQQLKESFPNTYLGIVYYSVTYTGWQENLYHILSKEALIIN